MATHREYVIERSKKVRTMVDALRANVTLRESFHEDPRSLAAEAQLSLTDEEVFMLRSAKDVDLDNIEERLMNAHFSAFDANCRC